MANLKKGEWGVYAVTNSFSLKFIKESKDDIPRLQEMDNGNADYFDFMDDGKFKRRQINRYSACDFEGTFSFDAEKQKVVIDVTKRSQLSFEANKKKEIFKILYLKDGLLVFKRNSKVHYLYNVEY
ncbi:MAG: hypothetical protein ACI8ZM_003005 [Crocinitomix sp.]